MDCDKTNDIHAYHDGELDPTRIAEVEAHLARCPPCAALLTSLRKLSGMLVRAPLPQVSVPIANFYAVWERNKDRALLRITSWLTAAAACLLLGALLAFPRNRTIATARPGPWEAAAVTPADQLPRESDAELVQVAQWMAADLSYPEKR